MDVRNALEEYGIQYVEDDKRFMVNCPFHEDSNPSCGIWKDSGYFRCFGCHETGDLADLISQFAGVPAASLRRRYRKPTAVDDLEDKIRGYLDTDETELKYFSIKSFRKNYPAVEFGTEAWQYLTGPDRKLLPETIKKFDIRQGTGKYRNRVVLPIYTPEGKLLSYVARGYKPSVIPKTKKARSPHRTFFGLFELLSVTLSKQFPYLVIVEGEFDAIYLQQFGVPAVANMGTSPMSGHKIRLLRKHASKVVLSYDPDDAGETAMYGKETDKGHKPGQYELLNPHIPTLTVDLPGKDPNDLTRNEIEEVYGGFI